ncbi:unnamed protein product [Toxocara canis]|uniref:UL46 n=1 Tax=Toxocara canis TaxID=6265 RepID=A0A183UUA9_TOXCA|nr:unnamed protein product [Toxocara canis]
MLIFKQLSEVTMKILFLKEHVTFYGTSEVADERDDTPVLGPIYGKAMTNEEIDELLRSLDNVYRHFGPTAALSCIVWRALYSTARDPNRLDQAMLSGSDAFVRIGSYLAAAIMVAIVAYLFDEYTYRNRIDLTPVKIDPRGYSVDELHLLNIPNAVNGCLHGIRPTIVGATKVLPVDEVFFDDKVNAQSAEPAIRTISKEGGLRVMAVHHYVDMTISMPNEVTAVGSFLDDAAADDSNESGRDADEPIHYTRTAEIVDNPLSGSVRAERRSKVPLVRSDGMPVAGTQSSPKSRHYKDQHSSRRKSRKHSVREIETKEKSVRRHPPLRAQPRFLSPKIRTDTTELSSPICVREMGTQSSQRHCSEQTAYRRKDMVTSVSTQESTRMTQDGGKKMRLVQVEATTPNAKKRLLAKDNEHGSEENSETSGVLPISERKG